VSSIRYNDAGFTIGANDGWGVKSVSFPGGICLGGVCKSSWDTVIETDPTVPAVVKAITATNISNWNTAYSWVNTNSANVLTTASSLSWSKLAGFPAACSAGQYVSAVGTTLTCSTPAGGVGGSGTASYLPKFTAVSTLGNSLVFDNGTNVGVGTTTPVAKLEVVGGPIKATGGLIMETRTNDPANQAVGQIWMCTDPGYDCQ